MDEGVTIDALTEQLSPLQEEWNNFQKEILALQKQLADNDELLDKLGELQKKEAEARKEFEKWRKLNSLLGDSEGNKFKKIAQSYVLESLLVTANNYMPMLTSGRYKLCVVPGTFIILIQDALQDDSIRVASTISGGETFLVSLALALALSEIGENLQVDTLFIDEGFGSLSGEKLQNALATLKKLHANTGRQVGVISHVPEVREQIPVQIQVQQAKNSSCSTIQIVPSMS